MPNSNVSALVQKCYVEWLGIPADECPPDYYRLLGLARFESNPDLIRAAAIARQRQIKNVATPDETKEAQAVLRQLKAVHDELLDETSKGIYDTNLRFVQQRSVGAGTRAAHKEGETSSNAALQSATKMRASGPPRARRAAATESPQPTHVEDADHPDRRIDQTHAQGKSVAGHAWGRPQWPLIGSLALNGMLLSLLIMSLMTRGRSDRDVTAAVGGSGTAPESSIPAAAAVAPSQDPPTSANNVASDDTDTDAFDSSTLGNATEEPSLPGQSPSDLAAAGVPGAAGPPMSSEIDEEPTPKPIGAAFDDLSTEFPLPEMPRSATEISKSSTAGKVSLSDFSLLTLSLDSSAADLSGRYQLAIEDADSNERESKRWRVVIKPTGNQTGATDQVGHFLVDELNQFRFLWEMSRPVPRAEQLANCLLTMTFKDEKKVLQLRSVSHQSRQPTELSGRDVKIPLQVFAPPSASTLGLRVMMHRDGLKPDVPQSQSPTVKDGTLKSVHSTLPILAQFDGSGGAPLPLNTPHMFPVDSQEMVKVALRLDQAESSSDTFQLGMATRVRISEDRGGTYVTKSIDDLNDDLNQLVRRIREDVAAYGNAINQILIATPQLNKLQGDLSRLRGMANQNPQQAGRLANQMGALSGQIQKLQFGINKANGTVARRRKTIPKSYETLAGKIAILRAVGAIHNKGELEYHMVATAGSGEIRLMSGDGLPDAIRQAFVVPPFRLTGDWFRLDGMTYTLGGTNESGTARISKTFDKRVPPVSGTWSRVGQDVIVDAGTIKESYRLHEDIVMRSTTATLFRLP
ncbi:hypothetical protein Enr13x_20800 [Stieleria neptunia]|uniref:J domain-containing protein n=1 Tax=Stieleria neptunia TaxID=2527979 RepID=A0A518HN04_9BACT|nr:hypothetical protein [Stieleria neptunia]QDV42235.1 hypothetical protein Enr13x_20800 [Stieleria neptunia]